jgi:hypothetical protein
MGRTRPLAVDPVRFLGVPLMNNNTGILIHWLAISHRPELRWDQVSTQRYFFPQPQPGFLHRLGVPENYSVTPYSLTPRDSFYLLASRGLPDAAFSHEQRHLPFQLHLRGRDAEIISIVSRMYPLGIQTVRITARLQLDSGAPTNELLDQLQPFRKPHTVRSADHITRMAFALATGDRTVDLTSLTYRTYFGMQISLPVPADQVPTYVTTHKASIIALLIGNPQPNAQSARIIDLITGENQRINEKSSFEYLLENRAGLIYLRPSSGYISPHPERFRRSLDIAEMALYVNAFLEFSSGERRKNENLVDFLMSKIETWITAPEVVFSSSMTSQLQWEVLSSAFSLPSSLRQWQRIQGGDDIVANSKYNLFRNVPTDWYLISNLAEFLDKLTP